MIEYAIGTSDQVLVFTDSVLDHFKRYRQTRCWHREAGGQLFAKLYSERIIIEEATGPRRTDRRTRTSYIPDRIAEQAEIDQRYPRNLHYIGDWHTHPEAIPRPSPTDIASMIDCFKKSKHTLNAFILVIIGQLALPAALHVSLHDGQSWYPITALG